MGYTLNDKIFYRLMHILFATFFVYVKMRELFEVTDLDGIFYVTLKYDTETRPQIPSKFFKECQNAFVIEYLCKKISEFGRKCLVIL
jgi:hypothetical protein